jgi:NarL family two-component system response regulator LiaR
LERERDRIRILLADGQHLVRQGIRQLLEREGDFEVIAEADNGLEALRLARELKPDVVIMEAHMARLDSVEATRRVKTELPETAVIILTACEDEGYIVGLLGAGASGYLLKSTRGEELVQGIRFVQAGEFVSHPLVAQKLFKRATRRPLAVNSVEHLTNRELEVLKLAARGMSNRDIAAELGVGLRTVKGHLMTIFEKMGVRSRTEAVLKALRQGWVRLDEE